MAKKMYFQLQPEWFKLYERISREGDIKLTRAEAFDVSDPYYNRLIFIAKQKKLKGRINIREQVTGTKFVLKVIPREDKGAIVKVYSNKLELRTYGEILLQDAVLPQQKASGFYCSFKPVLTSDEKENEKRASEALDLKQNYVGNVVDFFTDAKVAARNYKNDIHMQDKQVQKNLRQLSRRLR